MDDPDRLRIQYEIAVLQHQQNLVELGLHQVDVIRRRRKRRGHQRFWVRPWIGRRRQFNLYVQLLLMNDITDHLPIFALCNYEIENKKSYPVKYVRNLKNENVSLLIESLSQELWNNVLQSDDVNVAYINFIETFSKLYNLHCPVKKAHAKGIYKNRGLQMDLKMRVVRKMVFTGHFFGREPTLQNIGIKRTKIN